jgi:hypothetical protein
VTSRLEQDLERTLKAAAAGAPDPAMDFLADVRRRQRRQRTRRRQAVAALAAVLCLAGTLALAGHANPFRRFGPAANPTATPSASALGSRVPIVYLLRPATTLWPSALHKSPATLPDGSAYQVAAVLGGERYLVTMGAPQWTGTGASQYPSIGATGVGVFDVKAHAVRMLSSPHATDGVAPRVAGRIGYGLLYPPMVADDVVTWAATGTALDGSTFTEVWAARISTGTAARLTRLPGGTEPRSGSVTAQVGAPRPVGDTVVWTRYSTGRTPRTPVGIYRVPATGGTPTQVPGTTGYELATGAWAQPVGTENDLFNVLTGQHLRIPRGGDHHDVRLDCTPVWCAGAGVERHAWAVVPADGRPGPTELNLSYTLAAGGRVALAPNLDPRGDSQGVVVWNPATGVWGGLDSRYLLPAAPAADLPVLTVPSTHGSQVEVFDLTVAAR